MRYRSRSTGIIVDAVRLSDETFATPHPIPERIFAGVLYDRQQRRAFIKNQVAKSGDWILRDQLGNLSVCSDAAFRREYRPINRMSSRFVDLVSKARGSMVTLWTIGFITAGTNRWQLLAASRHRGPLKPCSVPA